MSHSHSCSCSHDSVKYCSHCNLVYCEGCSMEWKTGFTWYYPNYQSTGGIYNGIASTGGGYVPTTPTQLVSSAGHSHGA